MKNLIKKSLLALLTISSINSLQLHSKINVEALQKKRANREQQDQGRSFGSIPTEGEAAAIAEEEALIHQEIITNIQTLSTIIERYITENKYMHEALNALEPSTTQNEILTALGEQDSRLTALKVDIEAIFNADTIEEKILKLEAVRLEVSEEKNETEKLYTSFQHEYANQQLKAISIQFNQLVKSTEGIIIRIKKLPPSLPAIVEKNLKLVLDQAEKAVIRLRKKEEESNSKINEHDIDTKEGAVALLKEVVEIETSNLSTTIKYFLIWANHKDVIKRQEEVNYQRQQRADLNLSEICSRLKKTKSTTVDLINKIEKMLEGKNDAAKEASVTIQTDLENAIFYIDEQMKAIDHINVEQNIDTKESNIKGLNESVKKVEIGISNILPKAKMLLAILKLSDKDRKRKQSQVAGKNSKARR